MDTRLPFGLRSAPKLFTALADAVQWLIKDRGVEFCIHYLDEYVFVEAPQVEAHALTTVTQVLSDLGIPIAPDMVEGPATTLVFSGIELDSHALTALLLADKLQHLKSMVSEWQGLKPCTKRKLLSLVGIAQHATMVVHFGRVFLRHMIDLASSVAELHHFVCLNRQFQSDLQ